MEVKVYCEKCKKYELINIDKEKKAVDTPPGIPAPDGSSGLDTYSVVHNDHTLVVDVDGHGNVRSEKTINRLGLNLEQIMSAISSKLIKQLENKPDEQLFLAVIGQNKPMRNIIIGISHQLLLNLSPTIEANLSIDKGSSKFQYGRLQIYQGDWNDELNKINANNVVLAYHVTENNIDVMIDQIKVGIDKDLADIYGILFNKKVTNHDKWQSLMKEVLTPNPEVFVTDVGTSVKIATSFNLMLDKLLST